MLTGGFTVTDKDCAVLTAPRESVTITENWYGVAAVTVGAVPESVVPFSESHDGKPVAFHVKGAVPPLAASDCEYASADVVAGSDVVVTEGTGLTVRLQVAGKSCPLKSVAVVLNE